MYQLTPVQKQIYGNGTSLLLCGSVMRLPAEIRALAGQAQCVYLDPPFMTGKTFPRRRFCGEQGWRKGSPVLTLPGFEDALSGQDYLDLLDAMIRTAHVLLADTGVFCLHLDWRASARARLMCDQVFGAGLFLNEIVWSYESGGRTMKCFPRKHDTLLLYAKTKRYRFDLTRVPLDRKKHRKNHMARCMDEDGRTYSRILSGGKEYRYYDDDPVYPGDVWTDIGFLQQRDPERTGYATQKPIKLLDRVLRPVVREGDWVVDLCCGSGTTLAAAQALGCRFAGLDVSPHAIAVSLHRLEPEDLTVLCPCGEERAELLASWDSASSRLHLEGLRLPESKALAGVSPADALESWAPGRIVGDAFFSEAFYRRTSRFPALSDSLRADTPPGAILATDAAGVRHAFIWKEKNN